MVVIRESAGYWSCNPNHFLFKAFSDLWERLCVNGPVWCSWRRWRCHQQKALIENICSTFRKSSGQSVKTNMLTRILTRPIVKGVRKRIWNRKQIEAEGKEDWQFTSERTDNIHYIKLYEFSFLRKILKLLL